MSCSVIKVFFLILLFSPCLFSQTTGRSAYLKSSSIVRYENPWSGSIVFDVSRATDINHSLILNPENPDERKEYSAILIGSLKYKWNRRHVMGVTGAVSRDIIKNSSDADAEKIQPKNVRLGYSYFSDLSVLGSLPIEWPLSVSLPTTSLAQSMGMIASYRVKPSLVWPFLEIYSFIYAHETNLNLYHPTDVESSQEKIMETSTVSTIHTFILTMQATEIISLSQSIGMTVLSKNIKNIFGMDQTGSSLNLSTGVSFFFKPSYSLDLMVSQSAPLQGTGAGATRVYEDNTFRPYHIAQSTWAVTGTYNF